jgi:hypothetical protein
MQTSSLNFRRLALMLVALMIFTVAVPARAEAIPAMALAGAIFAGVLIVVALVLWTKSDSRTAQSELRYLVCFTPDHEFPACWALSQGELPAVPGDAPQGA